MFKKIIILFALISVVPIFALPTVISIDTTMSQNSDKNLLGALGLSLILPGAGEKYLNTDKRSHVFMWTDFALLGLTGISYAFGEGYLSSAQSYSVRYGGATNPKRDLNFLELMGEYESRGGHTGMNSSPEGYEDYNQSMIRKGLDIEKEYPNTETFSWDWGISDNPENQKNLNKYNKMLSNYRVSKIIFQASIGALVLNRLVSMIDVIQIHRSTANSKITLNIVPIISQTTKGGVLVMNF